MLNGFLGLGGVILAVVLWGMGRTRSSSAAPASKEGLTLWLACLGLVLSGVAWTQWSTHPTAAYLVWGVSAGLVIGWLAQKWGQSSDPRGHAAIGLSLGASLVAFLSWRPGLVPPLLLLAGCVGLGASAVVARIQRSPGAMVGVYAAVISLPLAFLSILGGARRVPLLELSGGVVGLALALAAAVALVIPCDEKKQGIRVAVMASLTAILGWALSDAWLGIKGSDLLALAGAVAAALSLWALPEEDSDNRLLYGVVGMIFLGLATFGFSSASGWGLAMVTASLMGVLVFARAGRATLIASWLVALGALRVVREVYPASIRAFDIGQHYAFLGLLAGITLVLALVAWGQRRPPAIATLAMGLSGFLGLAAGMILLGARGSLGLIVGVLIGAGLAGFSRERCPSILAGASGACALLLAWMRPFDPWFSLARDTKLMVVGGLVTATLVLAGIAVKGSPASEVQTS